MRILNAVTVMRKIEARKAVLLSISQSGNVTKCQANPVQFAGHLDVGVYSPTPQLSSKYSDLERLLQKTLSAAPQKI